MSKKKKKTNASADRAVDPYLAPGLFNAVSPEFTPGTETRRLGTPDENVERFFDVLPELRGDRFPE